MAPAQTLRWIENGKGPAVENVEIEGTEPYIVGGHTGSGYWVDTKRATTVAGLYAAGDVAGGSPQKYVTGCFAEGEIAAMSALEYSKGKINSWPADDEINKKLAAINRFLINNPGFYSIEDMEDAMQKTMDTYAGGISSGYSYNAKTLQIAKERIDELLELSNNLTAQDLHQLMHIYEVIDRLYVAKILIRHLEARKETRWHSFQEHVDYPDKDDENWLRYVNSRLKDGKVEVILRDLVKKDEIYEHKD
jgi:adenylylsulfate reductase, subunit A